MWFDVVLKYLIDNYPQIGLGCILLFLICFLVYKCTKFYLKTKGVCDDFPALKKLLEKIDKGFTTLNQILIEKNVISTSCYSEGNSPRSLNERGEMLYKESGAERLFIQIKDELILELEKRGQDSSLELEANALKVMFDKMNDPEFKDVQNFAYNHPNFNGTSLTYTDILFVMALKLRDAHIEKHKGDRP